MRKLLHREQKYTRGPASCPVRATSKVEINADPLQNMSVCMLRNKNYSVIIGRDILMRMTAVK